MQVTEDTTHAALTKPFIAAFNIASNGSRKVRRGAMHKFGKARSALDSNVNGKTQKIGKILGYTAFIAVMTALVAVVTYLNMVFAALLSMLWTPLGYAYLALFFFQVFSWGMAVFSWYNENRKMRNAAVAFDSFMNDFGVATA